MERASKPPSVVRSAPQVSPPEPKSDSLKIDTGTVTVQLRINFTTIGSSSTFRSLPESESPEHRLPSVHRDLDARDSDSLGQLTVTQTVSGTSSECHRSLPALEAGPGNLSLRLPCGGISPADFLEVQIDITLAPGTTSHVLPKCKHSLLISMFDIIFK